MDMYKKKKILKEVIRLSGWTFLWCRLKEKKKKKNGK